MFDKKFGKHIKWDIPLLKGYDYQFVRNTAKEQGTHSWRGIVNPTLIDEIEEWQADAVLVYGWNFQSHFKAMRHFKGKIPVLFRGDSTLLGETKSIRTILRRVVLNFVYRYIDYALYVGINNKEYFLKHGVADNNLIFSPHSVDNERFSVAASQFSDEVDKWRKRLNISEETLVFLFAGKFEPKKNPMLIIEAAKQLSDFDFKFILAGSGILENELKQAAKNMENIIFLPFQNQSKMPALYALGDVFVLPSSGRGETWGLAINEAMSCRRAILASSEVGCAVDLVENNKNGYIFESRNLSDFVSKIKSFDKKNIAKMGEYSLRRIEKYNFTAICEAIEKIVVKL